MKKARQGKKTWRMLPEYDFSTGVRGKYAKRYTEGTNIVVLAPDVARSYKDSHSVNEALRSLAKFLHQQEEIAS